jgi:hypothetical protein
MTRLWGKTFNYENVLPGDELPTLIKWVHFQPDEGLKDQFYDIEALKDYVYEAVSKTIPVDKSYDYYDWIQIDLLRQIPLTINLSVSGTVINTQSEELKVINLEFEFESDAKIIYGIASASVPVRILL